MSDQLSKQAEKLIRSAEIHNSVISDGYTSQLNDIDKRLEDIEKERKELMNRKLQIISELQKKNKLVDKHNNSKTLYVRNLCVFKEERSPPTSRSHPERI